MYALFKKAARPLLVCGSLAGCMVPPTMRQCNEITDPQRSRDCLIKNIEDRSEMDTGNKYYFFHHPEADPMHRTYNMQDILSP